MRNKERDMNTEHVMNHKGFSAAVMEAERLIGDVVHGLPPGHALPVYCSDIFKEYPENWMRGPGVFIIPVKPNKGIWFNWTGNDSANTAVLPTVKGCNPITGLQTSGYHLERYDNKCPKHGKEFKHGRFCEECGYKWPFGNYVAGPNILWLDGYRIGSEVRQFFFTEDEVRDIATRMIGKENTVPAFGFAFYRPKVERPKAAKSFGSGYFSSPNSGTYDIKELYLMGPGYYSTSVTYDSCYGSNSTPTSGGGAGAMSCLSVGASSTEMSKDLDDSNMVFCAAAAPASSPPKSLRKALRLSSIIEEKTSGGLIMEDALVEDEKSSARKEVSVGAGARISQDLVEDPYPLDSWKDTPDSVMTIYFVFKDEVDRMLSKGVVETVEKPEGMLAGLPVG